MNPTLKAWLSVAATTAGGALVTYLSTQITSGGIPTTESALKSLATGALVAVAASLIHLFQMPPGKTAVTP